MTRNGIVYDLINTPYYYSIGGITYFFSSLIHRNKFIKRMRMHRTIINDKLSKRWRFGLSLNFLADINLYSKIETRGFLIRYDFNGELISCLNNITLSGEISTLKNSPKQSETLTKKDGG